MIDLYYPLQSLKEGSWFKLICGASFQHLPAIRNLVLAYTLAGADCIDVAADPAVILAAQKALEVAFGLAEKSRQRGFLYRAMPLLMVSFNDGEDPHFRKANFIAENCPADCLRPCEAVCPAQAIDVSGVMSDRCYGCGRCLPVCPVQHITTHAYVSTPAAIAPLVLETGVDAIEIHTQVGRSQEFQRLWKTIAPYISHLKLIAISCPDGDGFVDYLWSLYDIISPLPCPLIWQTDGRPMSGDIGAGATRAAIRLGQKALAAGLPGYVQLAGGTNHRTVPKLQSLGLLKSSAPIPSCSCPLPSSLHHPYVAGVAYGSYARTLLTPILNQLEGMETAATSRSYGTSSVASWLSKHSSPLPSHITQPAAVTSLAYPIYLEEDSELLWQAVNLANTLVAQLKSPCKTDKLSLEGQQ